MSMASVTIDISRPRKYYSTWTDSQTVERIGSISLQERVTVYVQLSTDPPPCLNVARGRIVAVIRRGLRAGSSELNLWLSYAQRCCPSAHRLSAPSWTHAPAPPARRAHRPGRPGRPRDSRRGR